MILWSALAWGGDARFAMESSDEVQSGKVRSVLNLRTGKLLQGAEWRGNARQYKVRSTMNLWRGEAMQGLVC